MLYIVGTPIGNLEDFSIRGAQTLLAAQVVLAEDTRSAGVLIEYACKIISTKRRADSKVLSYHKDNEYQRLPEAMDLLESGKNVVLISQAGMPIISDPGLLLVKTCHKRGIKVSVIPGPTAVDSAVALSGLPHDSFHFVGFLPKKQTHILSLLAKLEKESQIHKGEVLFVAYESPERVNDTLALMSEKYPQIQIVVCRELTKIYEEVLINPKSLDIAKGEITICFKM